jgi:hypothetical protein
MTDAEFPDSEEGIEIWRAEEGGVFNIPVAEIVDLVDDVSEHSGPSN